MHWEKQKNIEMDEKNEDHHDKSFCVVHVVPINEKSMPHVTKFSMEMDLDEHCLNLMIGGNKMCSVSNHETLTSKVV